MTTRELADLLDHLKQGLAPCLRAESGRAFDEAAAAFRELPDQPLKKLAEQLRKANGNVNGTAGNKANKTTVDLPAVIDHIRAVRTGTVTDAVIELDGLTNTQLRAVLAAFSQSPTRTTVGNLAKVKQLLARPGDPNGVTPVAQPQDLALIERGVQLYGELRDTKGLSITEVRASFAKLRDYPKGVVEEISRRLGYTPFGSRKEILDRLQVNLESIKMNQLRAEYVGSGA